MSSDLSNLAFVSWLDAYRQAWEGRDPDAAAQLFAASALYFETPFDEPLAGREAIHAYWSKVTKLQSEVGFISRPIAVAASTGVAQWQASFVRNSTGSLVELDGVLEVTFDGKLRCTLFREWWHRRETSARTQKDTEVKG